MGPRNHGSRLLDVDARVVYSVAELARIGNVPAYRLRRLLRHNGVAFLRVGRAYYVTLAEVREKIPPLWESLCMAEDLRLRAGSARREPRDAAPRSRRTPRTPRTPGAVLP